MPVVTVETSDEPRLILRGVEKSYVSGPPLRRERRDVLRGVDLELGAGRAVALRGANGTGKTTLLRVVTGLLEVDRGSVEVLGRSPLVPAVRSSIGFSAGDERGANPRLTLRENLAFFGGLYGLAGSGLARRIDAVAEEFELGELLARRVDACSSGMRARLGLARALLHAPKLVVLDEPTKSLDVELASRVRARLRRRVEGEGLSLIVATHSSDEANELGAQVLILDAGKLVAA